MRLAGFRISNIRGYNPAPAIFLKHLQYIISLRILICRRLKINPHGWEPVHLSAESKWVYQAAPNILVSLVLLCDEIRYHTSPRYTICVLTWFDEAGIYRTIKTWYARGTNIGWLISYGRDNYRTSFAAKGPRWEQEAKPSDVNFSLWQARFYGEASCSAPPIRT